MYDLWSMEMYKVSCMVFGSDLWVGKQGKDPRDK